MLENRQIVIDGFNQYQNGERALRGSFEHGRFGREVVAEAIPELFGNGLALPRFSQCRSCKGSARTLRQKVTSALSISLAKPAPRVALWCSMMACAGSTGVSMQV